jgi:predicted kinase
MKTKREPMPGDQFTLSSGRKVVLHSKLPDGSWKAQYLENALKRVEEFVIIHPKELKP